MCNFEVEVRIMTEVSLLRKKEEAVLSVERVKESMRRFFAAYEYVLGILYLEVFYPVGDVTGL